MKPMRIILLAVGAPALVLAQPASERLSVEDAVKVATAQSDVVRQSRERARAADDAKLSFGAHMLPSVHVDEEAQRYTRPFTLPFAFPTPQGPLTPTVRDRDTNTLVVSAVQPVLGLLHGSQDLVAASRTHDAAEAAVEVAERTLSEEVETGYLRLFQSRAQEEIAKASQTQLSDQLGIARTRFKVGVNTRADLLRIQVAQANARLQQIQAQVQERVTRSNLLVALGRDPHDATVEFLEPTALQNAELPSVDSQSAQAAALQGRPEVKRAEAEASAAGYRQNARLFELLPEVNLEAAYVNVQGQAFAPKVSDFIGVKAQWAVWEWGATFFNHRAAAHLATAASLAADDQRRQVSVDASNKLELASASKAALEVAQATIAAAEEAYRVTDALVKAGSATTTDLLDSQSALTQAKLNWVRARYEQAIAIVALRRATGH